MAFNVACVLLLSVLSAALATAFVALVRLQGRVYFYGLRRYLIGLRRRLAQDDGLDLRWRLLRQLASEEACQLLAGGVIEEPEGRSPFRPLLPRWGIDLRARIAQALADPDVVADIIDRKKAEDRMKLEGDLLALADQLGRRWRQVVALVPLFSSAIVLAAAYRFASPPLPISTYVAVLLLTAPVAILIDRLMKPAPSHARREALAAASVPQPQSRADSPEEERIGRPGDHVRAINFSSGGFDTLMQLGVVHALVVIQGRAPDVVTGLSAGALHAAALAEVLQAGEQGETAHLLDKLAPKAPDQTRQQQFASLQIAEKKIVQRTRLLARVERLRTFIEYAQRAPERLLDAILPDAFQIDGGRPLHPLQQPRFSPDERARRGDFLSRRSGLAHLYNDLLSIPLSIATLTKVLRRILGLRASAEMRTRGRRFVMAAIESMRLWLLLGNHLIQAACVMPLFARIYIKPPKSNPGTAGAVIFRSRFWRGLVQGALYIGFFAFLFIAWGAMSLIAFPLYMLLTIPVAIVFAISWHDPLVRPLAWDGVQGMAGWAITLLLWSGVATALAILFLMPDLLDTAKSIGAAFSQPLADTFPLPVSHYVAKLGIPALVISLAVVGAAVALFLEISWNRWSFAERLLASYNLGDAIFKEHGLRTFLVELFDSNYFARPPTPRAVKAALEDSLTAEVPDEVATDNRTLAKYFHRDRVEPIHVALVVANTETGTLDVVPPRTLVVDGLMAATASTPWVPPVELEVTADNHVRKVLYIDGSNVTREPTRALMKLLREKCHDEARTAYIYSVAPFPISKPELGESRRPEVSSPPNRHSGAATAQRPAHYLNLVDIVWRAWRLQRFRDATLERRLTELFTGVIPPGDKAICKVGRTERYVRAWVTPVELEHDADLNRKLVSASKEDRRRIIEESLADGCRAALQVMIPDGIRAVEQQAKGKPVYARCALAVKAHLAQRVVQGGIDQEIADLALPGSDDNLGPGLAEICKRCCVKGETGALEQTLRLDTWEKVGPSWPHERETAPAATGSAEGAASTPSGDERFKRAESPRRSTLAKAWKVYHGNVPPEKRWPIARRGNPGQVRPTISLLFSGGVFRGVFQIGVLNALHQLRIQPDLIAGASVGSITAAMIARAFSIDLPGRSEHEIRLGQQHHIAWLAATYLAIDRLVLTDRFADFVRNFTVRAAETRFSIRNADRVFRKYDHQSLFSFDRNVRRVVAGIERLFYVSPYDLNDLVRTFRARETSGVNRLLREGVQQFLDRMQIGQEALGAEALSELIQEFAIASAPSRQSLGFTADDLRDQTGIQFLATATNLTDGRLEILGDLPSARREEGYVLRETLLASSAFPGVFRPRWSWELSPATGKVQQYIDGGVTDNLPMDAIAEFLNRAAQPGIGLVSLQPRAPHLIIGTSLEVNAPSYALAFTRRRFRNSWIALRKRAKQLGYNGKLDMYRDAENALRRIDRIGASSGAKRQVNLVHLQLLSVKPNRLCGTFAFHPMLGFRRELQARSIAHGCASTLMEFARFEAAGAAKSFEAWNIDSGAVSRATTWSAAFERLKGRDAGRHDERCWLRDRPCPFSRAYLHGIKPALPGSVIDEVAQIHRLCHQPQTHLRTI